MSRGWVDTTYSENEQGKLIYTMKWFFVYLDSLKWKKIEQKPKCVNMYDMYDCWDILDSE